MICTAEERDAIMAAVEQYGMTKYDIGQFNVRKDGRQYLESAVARSDTAYAAIRAMLAPHCAGATRDE